MEPGPPALGACSLIHWTTRDIPRAPLILGSSLPLLMVTLALTLPPPPASFIPKGLCGYTGPTHLVTQDHLPVLKPLLCFSVPFAM